MNDLVKQFSQTVQTAAPQIANALTNPGGFVAKKVIQQKPIQNYVQNRVNYYSQNPIQKMFSPTQLRPNPKFGGLPNPIGRTIQNIANLAPAPSPHLPPGFGSAGAIESTLGFYGGQALAKAPVINAALGQAGKVKLGTSKMASKLPLKIDRTQLTGRQLDIPSEELARRWSQFDAGRANLQIRQPGQMLQPQAKTALNPQSIDDFLPGETYASQTKPPTTLQTKSQESLAKSGTSQARSLDDIISRESTDVKSKVNFLDYARTPDRVLQKIGLKKEADLIRRQYDKYVSELPEEINKVTEWSKRVAPEANQKIFQYLDGKNVLLQGEELKVANEIKDYLSTWADKLKLPKHGRITNYITHIFDQDLVKKEFDDDLAKLIQDKIPGSIYDPFTQQRLGKLGYKEDTWQALDAYVKRGVRKYNMDPALEQVKRAADSLEISQFNYVKNYIDRVNMRPTEVDNLIDNFIKSTPVGYKLGARPLTVLSKRARQMVYRATLGLNPGTALKNLTQGANTYSRLGEKYTIIGYAKAAKSIATGSDELEKVGVLKGDFIEDRSLNATKKVLEKLDKGLFYFFEGAERINRGAAYFGAKSQGLSKGMDEQQAIEYAKKVVRDTQFTFGSIDTPSVLSSDIAKTLGQFQSYSLKQSEFLGEMIKNKDVKGLIRWGIASVVLLNTIGKLIGMEPKDLIPSARIGIPPTLQFPYEVGKAALNTPDKYGNERDLGQKASDVGKAALLFVPGSTQAKKTIQGIQAYQEGASKTPSGKTRFEVEQTPENLARGAIFGQYTLPGAKEYFDNIGKSKSEIVFNEFKKLETPEEKAALWNQMVQEGKITKDNVADVKKWFSDEKLGITPKERKMRGLGVEDGSRTQAILRELNSLSTPKEKADLWNKYVEAKIITKDVAKQLKEEFKNK